ncbi:hypothetical protein P2T59_03390 [Parabacteroides distasonis]|uniref:Uncharacterized protein n=1 Tax=Parabacteroides distasonis TaxID=823 RepID=A0AAX3QPX4_PARDI|nr:hypothetical protein [Parabacteroides distasonis]MCS2556999.1 hypothetical protein [Parabacteroides distasonis]WET65032.1 hypothetical protein P2T59_03390 [Parabacteroides distasonis]
MLTIITLFTGDIYFYPHFIHHTSVSVPVSSIAIPGTGKNAFLYRQ